MELQQVPEKLIQSRGLLGGWGWGGWGVGGKWRGRPTLGRAVAEILVRCSPPLGCYKIANSGLFASICRTISSFETGRALHFPVDWCRLGPASRLIMGNHRPLEETKKLRPTIRARETLRDACQASGLTEMQSIAQISTM